MISQIIYRSVTFPLLRVDYADGQLGGRRSTVKFFRKCPRLLIFVALLLAYAGLATAQGKAENFASNAPGNKFVGSTACKGCHAEIWDAFYKNPHNKSIVSGKQAPEKTGCEGCHGPGNNHIESFAAAGSIISFTKIPKEQVLDRCLTCHNQTLSRANIQIGRAHV